LVIDISYVIDLKIKFIFNIHKCEFNKYTKAQEAKLPTNLRTSKRKY